MAINFGPLSDQAGFLGACVVDSSTGMVLAIEGGGRIDLELAAAGNTEVVRAKLRTMKSLGLGDTIEDILITLTKQYHIIRPVQAKPGIFIYLVLDKARANLAMARRACQDTENSLTF